MLWQKGLFLSEAYCGAVFCRDWLLYSHVVAKLLKKIVGELVSSEKGKADRKFFLQRNVECQLQQLFLGLCSMCATYRTKPR